MGVSPDTMELTRFVLKNAEVPVIVDADGINCIASDIDILLQKKTDVIITALKDLFIRVHSGSGDTRTVLLFSV